MLSSASCVHQQSYKGLLDAVSERPLFIGNGGASCQVGTSVGIASFHGVGLDGVCGRGLTGYGSSPPSPSTAECLSAGMCEQICSNRGLHGRCHHRGVNCYAFTGGLNGCCCHYASADGQPSGAAHFDLLCLQILRTAHFTVPCGWYLGHLSFCPQRKSASIINKAHSLGRNEAISS